ncbi:PfkB family carbohydrate kinase [Kitasatospora sp. NPDC053057]|uniref:PfkB family carbohydrate kinase n=1 Tax=Kitasatospora sp. NPDC053057 TaxID=3364062 RepID=UPI0037C8F7D3
MPRQDTPGPDRAGPPPTAVCVGESMAVLLPDRPGPLEAVENFRLSVGGAESNVAGALAALGVPTAWISRVGDDGFGRRLLAALRRRFPSPATVVVKDAAQVVTALERDGTAVAEPALAVEVVEATGAGDAFAAGYLAGTVRGLDQRRRLRLGHLGAACALTGHGDQAELPPAPVVSALLDASPADWATTRVTTEGITSPALPSGRVRISAQAGPRSGTPADAARAQ